MNTLRGVFPEPTPIPKRNFIRENMMQIKRMQGLPENLEKKKSLRNLANNPKTMKLIQNTKKQLLDLSRLACPEKPKMITNTKSSHKNVSKRPSETDNKAHYKTAVESLKEKMLLEKKFKEIGIQTEHYNTLKQLYEKGTIKYPSGHVISILTQKKKEKHAPEVRSPRLCGDGDRSRRKAEREQSLSPRRVELSPRVGDNGSGGGGSGGNDKKHDYVRENAQVVKNLGGRGGDKERGDPTVPPPTYQKGVVPKYIRERKEEMVKKLKGTEGDEKCPEGHVVLPENERKETLRMLRQSYAELVTELNMMPVRSDTLKIRNRKVEIENQLKKLDEGIKVFTRPKVYVKIGA